MKKKTLELDRKTILVTGSPGFVGANLVLRLLKEVKNAHIISFDSMNDYYDPKLKEYRLSEIGKAAHGSGSEHSFIRADLADKAALDDVFARLRPRRAEPFRPLVQGVLRMIRPLDRSLPSPA